MFYFVLHVIHDQDKLEDLLAAWKNAGVKGITVLQSIGMCKLQEQVGLREDLPLLPTLNSLFETGETLNRTLFTVIEGDELLDKVIAQTELIVGDLDLPGTGILVVLPVVRALGLHRVDG
jgi:hypothetical protein